ncbi:MAG: SpaA isopeptide-forming pilin-related protein [Faecalibacterium sp.]
MKTKRLLASFLAVCMLMMACSTTLFAAAFATVDGTGANIIVSNDTATSGASLTGKIFDVYEVFTATLGAAATGSEDKYEQQIEYTVSDDFVAFFTSVLSSTDYTGTASNSNDSFNSAASEYVNSYTDDMATLVKQLRTYVLTTPNGVSPVTSTGENVTLSGTVQTVTTSGKDLLGYYLVLDSVDSLEGREDTASVITAGALVTVPTRNTSGYLANDTTIIIKGSSPTIDKQVWHNDITNTNDDLSPIYGDSGSWANVGDYEIGDTVEFRLTASMPSSLEGYEKVSYDKIENAIFDYTYVLTDTPSDGIKINVDSIKISVDPNFSSEVEGTYHYITATPDGGFQIVFDMVAIKQNFLSLPCFYVYYTATIDETATVTQNYETNTIELEYSTNPYIEGETTTTEDTVYTYTFDLDVFKTSGDGTSALADATFALYYANVGTDAGTQQIYLELLLDDEKQPVTLDGAVVYYVTDKTNASDIMPEDGYPAGTIVTGSTGKFTIIGLDDAISYRLVEIDPPDNYNAADPISFTIDAKYAENSDGTPVLTLTTTSNSDITAGSGNVLATTVINTSSLLLPTTGGAGTTLFTIVGFALVAIVGIVFYIKYKNI